MNKPAFEEIDFLWSNYIRMGAITILPTSHVVERNSGICTVLCPKCHPAMKDKLPLLFLAAYTFTGDA